jgi:hypothetical protein
VVVGTKRTWVGGETEYLGTGKAVSVAALRTNKEGRGIARGIPPALEAGDVYVLERDVMRYDVIRLVRG